jgi:hypothetical protein
VILATSRRDFDGNRRRRPDTGGNLRRYRRKDGWRFRTRGGVRKARYLIVNGLIRQALTSRMTSGSGDGNASMKAQ